MAKAAEVDLLLENQLCFALSVASRSVIQCYKPVLEPLGLTHPQYLVMLCLWERAPRTLRDISESLLHEPATLSPLIRRLEALGYVERTANAEDARALDIDLTPSGRSLREQATLVPGTMMERLGLIREQVAELNRTMHQLIAASTSTPATPGSTLDEAGSSERPSQRSAGDH